MSELFTTEESLSPRLRWMAKYGIATEFKSAAPPAMRWVAYVRNAEETEWASGTTEHDALAELAETIGLRLWNEEVEQ